MPGQHGAGAGHKLVMQRLIPHLHIIHLMQEIPRALVADAQGHVVAQGQGAAVDLVEGQVVPHLALEVGNHRTGVTLKQRDHLAGGPAVVLVDQVQRHLVVG